MTTMHVTKRWWVVLGVAGLLLLAVGCTNDSLDDGGGADVVLQIEDFGSDPVTASESEGACALEVQDWEVTISAVPLNETATTEFQNVRMQTVEITYQWVDPAVSATPTRVVGLGGATVAVNGSGAVSFAPISFNDLTIDKLGQTANLTLVFTGLTQDGEVVQETALRQLFVEAC